MRPKVCCAFVIYLPFNAFAQKCAIFGSYLALCSTAFLMTDFDSTAMSRLLEKINTLRSRNAGPFSWRRLRIQEIKMPFKTPQMNFAEFIEDFHSFLHCDATWDSQIFAGMRSAWRQQIIRQMHLKNLRILSVFIIHLWFLPQRTVFFVFLWFA